MPDLDDIFEDIFDGVKKHLKKQKKRANDNGVPSLLIRMFGRRDDVPGKHTAAAQRADRNVPTEPGAPDEPLANGPCSAVLRGYVQQADAYHRGMMALVQGASSEFNRARLDELVRYIDHWQSALIALVERVDQYQQNTLLQNDMKGVPKAIARLETQLSEASSTRIQEELKRTLANRQRQLAALKSLNDTMQWAEIKIENTVSMLGSIYSQALMSQSKGQVADYHRLLVEVEEEARTLDDYVAALVEVKLGNAPATSFNLVG